MTRFDIRKARLKKAQDECKRQMLKSIGNRRAGLDSMFYQKRLTPHSLAHACRIAMQMSSNPMFIEAMQTAAEIFEEAEKEAKTMATSIPIDVMRDMRNKISSMRAISNQIRSNAEREIIKADVLLVEASKLEDIADSWQKSFPDTEKL